MFIVETGVIAGFGVAGNMLGLSGLEKSSLAGMNFVNSNPLGSNLSLGLNNINVGAVAGASASSIGSSDIAVYAALGVFLLGALFLLLDKKVLRV